MTIEISAVSRAAKGTGASRRLRREAKVPGIVYGAGKDPVSVEFDAKALFMEFRHEAFHASILTLNLDGKKESVLLRDYQMHPVRNTIQHIDFQRVSATEKIHVKVPLHFINAEVAPGVKLGGGIVAHIATEADVSCLAKDLPEFVEVDLANLEMGHSVHLSEIKLPKGVEFVQLAHGNDLAVASIAKTRGSSAAAEETPAAAAAPEATPEA
ncbi:MAG: 50S ribosomal protein L25/general stress protein Ctc [Methylophilaceae bacterium]|jgi:large subunit ribosomal protein L25|nr:50S ribosomal protein L25/general stress protein Ctc [Methylophilaceae bacterium]NCA26771.1 50S ribosomal protein L25/general stress protein Ctc [Methylophilaceae bacterium]